MKRIGCFTQTLQLVALTFDKYVGFKELLKRTHDLIHKVNSSTKATERLINACGKKLLKNCPTRWNSSFLMIEHLLNVQDPLTKVLQDMEWDNLAASEWKGLHALKTLLQPLAEFTSLLSGDEFTTISCALPTTMDLNLHFEEMKSHSDSRIREVASIMQLDLKRLQEVYRSVRFSV